MEICIKKTWPGGYYYKNWKGISNVFQSSVNAVLTYLKQMEIRLVYMNSVYSNLPESSPLVPKVEEDAKEIQYTSTFHL
jgi:hypothetical protein